MKYSMTFAALAAVTSAQQFTSIFNITATPDQVIANSGAAAPGQPGAIGQFNYAIDSTTDTICYDITLTGVTGDYQSPARTATHIHQGVKGSAGPPRIAFPNPGPVTDGVRRSSGCLTGPFLTGIKAADNVTDTGAGFKLSQIEANPAGFFTDSHTALFVAGVVRGQLDQGFKIIAPVYPVYPVYPTNGSVITTATLTKTEEITITKCPAEKTDCPAASKYPVVTKTEKVYTTVCPVSELPHYTKPVETHPIYETKSKPVETHPIYETKSKPAETHPGAVATYPVNSPPAGVTKTYVPIGTGAPTGTPVQPTGIQVTGAASANKIGGGLFAAAFVAALL